MFFFVVLSMMIVGVYANEYNLCGTSSSGVGSESQVNDFCTFPSQALASQKNWDSCCPIDVNPVKDEVCRTFTVNGAYCSDTEEECAVALSTQKAVLDIQISWTSGTAGSNQCCKTCTCFGDPECVGFDGNQDLWIPCDARVMNEAGWCPIWKYRCDEISSENDGGCMWIGGDLESTQGLYTGWDIATQGSPCVPKKPVNELTMKMYESGSFKAILGMGERGVIKTLYLKTGSVDTSIDADGCFSTGTIKDWSGDMTTLPENWFVEVVSDEMVKWHIHDNNEMIAIDFVCVRTIKNNIVGAARINVNGITAPITSSGSGFCETSVIAEAGDNNPITQSLHAKCVQDRTSSYLQACKNLVAMSATEMEMEQCAHQFCNTAALSIAEKKACKTQLPMFKYDFKMWRKWYCIAIANEGDYSSSTCVHNVNKDGWNKATQLMGRALKHDDTAYGSVQCPTDIESYKVDKNSGQDECRQGAFLQVKTSDDTWEDAYFFPAICSAVDIEITYSSATSDLFTKPFRLIQCDAQTKSTCRALGRCNDVPGAVFDINFKTIGTSVQDVINAGGYVCIPVADGSGKFSCSDGSDSNTINLCPC